MSDGAPLTPESWNRCKTELPVGDKADLIAAGGWMVEWWKSIVLFIDRCMAEHEQSIYPSTRWSTGHAHLRSSDRVPGQIVVQLPIVVDRAELVLMLRGLNEILAALDVAEK